MRFLFSLLVAVVAVNGAAIDSSCCGRAVAAGPVAIDTSNPTTVAPVPDVMDWLKRAIVNAPLRPSTTHSQTSATGRPQSTTRTSSATPTATVKPSGKAVFAHYMVRVKWFRVGCMIAKIGTGRNDDFSRSIRGCSRRKGYGSRRLRTERGHGYPVMVTVVSSSHVRRGQYPWI